MRGLILKVSGSYRAIGTIFASKAGVGGGEYERGYYPYRWGGGGGPGLPPECLGSNLRPSSVLVSAVFNALACRHCDHGLNPDLCMWQGSGLLSKVCCFPRVLQFPPSHMTTERQHPCLRERVYKFFELSV